LDDVGSYDLEDEESSSAESARRDGWEEQEADESGPIAVQVEDPQSHVTLARFEEDDEQLEERSQRITQAAHVRQNRPKSKRPVEPQPRRRPNNGGPWTPGRS
jgi:hypothetical protein